MSGRVRGTSGRIILTVSGKPEKSTWVIQNVNVKEKRFDEAV